MANKEKDNLADGMVEGASGDAPEVALEAKKANWASAAMWAGLLMLALAAATLVRLTAMADDSSVMTAGGADIAQAEQEGFGIDQGLVSAGGQNEVLYPGESVSKIVSVTNNGVESVYFRTLVAVEDVPGDDSYEVRLGTGGEADYEVAWIEGIELDGVVYRVCMLTYRSALAPNITQTPLSSIGFADTCTNEHMAALGGDLEIIVISQAGQVAGYEGCAAEDGPSAALDKQFGSATDAEKLKTWLSNAKSKSGSGVAAQAVTEQGQ